MLVANPHVIESLSETKFMRRAAQIVVGVYQRFSVSVLTIIDILNCFVKSVCARFIFIKKATIFQMFFNFSNFLWIKFSHRCASVLNSCFCLKT